jgi:hypothetical protein
MLLSALTPLTGGFNALTYPFQIDAETSCEPFEVIGKIFLIEQAR